MSDDGDRLPRELEYPFNLHLIADDLGVVHLFEQRHGVLREFGVLAEHGRGSLGHGWTPDCDDEQWEESCNNGQCRAGLMHERCTAACSAEVVWDAIGCWTPHAEHLKPT